VSGDREPSAQAPFLVSVRGQLDAKTSIHLIDFILSLPWWFWCLFGVYRSPKIESIAAKR